MRDWSTKLSEYSLTVDLQNAFPSSIKTGCLGEKENIVDGEDTADQARYDVHMHIATHWNLILQSMIWCWKKISLSGKKITCYANRLRV